MSPIPRKAEELDLEELLNRDDRPSDHRIAPIKEKTRPKKNNVSAIARSDSSSLDDQNIEDNENIDPKIV